MLKLNLETEDCKEIIRDFSNQFINFSAIKEDAHIQQDSIDSLPHAMATLQEF